MSKNILVVDTPQSPLHPLVQLLSDHGYLPTVLLPSDNPVAQFTATEYELVFLALPEVDARAICNGIRQLAEGAITPIIFVGTGEEAIRSPADALSAGGDFYFKLPFDPLRVLAKVHTYVGPGQTRGPSKPTAVSGAPAAPTPGLANASDAVLAKIVHQEAELARLAEAARQRTSQEETLRREQQVAETQRQAQERREREAEHETRRKAAEQQAFDVAEAARQRDAAELEERQAAAELARAAETQDRRRAEQEQRQRRAAAHAVRKAEQQAQERAAAEAAASAEIRHQGRLEDAPGAEAEAAPEPPDSAALQRVAQALGGDGDLAPASRPLRPESGTLSASAPFDIAALMAQAWRQSITGSIELNHGTEQRTLFFENGVPVDSRSNQPFDRIEEFLHREGKITQSQYQAVRLKRLHSARQVGAYLVSAGHLKPEELFTVVRGHLEDQVYSCFEWDEATYRYHRQAAREADRVALDTDPRAMMMEGIRRKYLLPRLVARIGAPSSLVALTGSATEDLAALQLSRAEQGIARLLDGQRNLEDVVFSGGQEALRVYQVAHALITIDAAKVLVRGLEGPRPPDANADAIDRERIADKLEQVRLTDYFHILGIPRTATPYEVERACGQVSLDFQEGRFSSAVQRDMASQLHEIAEVLGEAQEVLLDTPRRAAYARHLP